MTNSVPLIRAAAVVPWVAWLKARGRPVQSSLEAADLAFLPIDRPNRAIPLRNGVEFIRQQSRLEGPDLACRVVSDMSIRDLANLGLVILNARTPRDSMERVGRALPRHCTHEVIGVEETPTGILMREYWLCRFDAEALHFNQLYVAAIVASILRLTGGDDPLFQMLRLVPHPETGLRHVSAWCGCPVQASLYPHLEIEVASDIADARFDQKRVGPALPSVPSKDDWPRLRRSYMVSDSVAVVIEAMLGVGAVSIDRVAAASDMPVRTLQRQLADEGTDFSALLDRARKAKAMELLAEGSASFADIAMMLGYANPPAFTRAFRRWTGETPRRFQRRQGPV